MHYKLMFPSNYLSAADLQGKEVEVEIESVNVEELTMVGGRKNKKAVVKFKGAKKAFVMNKTNAVVIAGKHGNETDNWIGKKIRLFATQTKFGGKDVECVRVKE